jgi:hypothetical protein
MPKPFYDYSTRTSNPVEGELIVCKSNKLKLFDIGNIYIGEKYGINRGHRGKIKFKGIPGYHNPDYFDFVENNPALHRQVQMDSVFDLNPAQTKVTEGRKIDRIPNKNKILIQAMTQSLFNILGDSTKMSDVNDNFSFDKVIDTTIKSVYRRYDITKEDYDNLSNMTLSDIFDNFIKEKNG